MSRNNRTNNLIKWIVILFDFVLLNAVLLVFSQLHPKMLALNQSRLELFWLTSNFALVMSEYKFYTIIHLRITSMSDIVKRVINLITFQTLVAYLMLKAIDLRQPVGKLLMTIGVCLILLLLLIRFGERLLVKKYRRLGRNTRTVTFVGTDPEQEIMYRKLINSPTTGYRLLGYYGEKGAWDVNWLGTEKELVDRLLRNEKVVMGDDMFVCLSRREIDTVRTLSKACDLHMVRFFYVPISVEAFGINLHREFLDDIEIYTTYEIPLVNPVNKFIKRLFDIVFSSLLLLFTLPFLPIVALIIKWQSPGPIFFRQLRTGLDGRDFYCYKLRSMHVNKDADTVQATKDDPRKYAFGNFMRKANIDELPQFWNVLKGDMSIVGPRPHMLAHTEMYSQLIDKYMVRHFVKPGWRNRSIPTQFRTSESTHSVMKMTMEWP